MTTLPTILYIGPSNARKKMDRRYMDVVDLGTAQQIPEPYRDVSNIELLTKYFGPEPAPYADLSGEEKTRLLGILDSRIVGLEQTLRVFPPTSLKNASYGNKIQRMKLLRDEIQTQTYLSPAQTACELAVQRAAAAAGTAAGAAAAAAGTAAGAVAAGVRGTAGAFAGAAGAVGRAVLPRIPAAELIDNTFHAAYLLLGREDPSTSLAQINNEWVALQGRVQAATLGQVLEILTAGRNDPTPIEILSQAYNVFKIQEALGINRTTDVQTRLKQGYEPIFDRLYQSAEDISSNRTLIEEVGAIPRPLPDAQGLGRLLENLVTHTDTPIPAPLNALSPREKAIFGIAVLLLQEYMNENA